MTTEEKKKSSFRLVDIPIDQCKLFEIEGQKVAVCHDSDEKFRFYKLEPVTKKKESL